MLGILIFLDYRFLFFWSIVAATIISMHILS